MDPTRLPDRAGRKPVKVLVGYDQEVAELVRGQLGMDGGFGPCSAIGFVLDGKLIGGLVYHNYRKPNIEMSIATISPYWCNRSTLFHVFNYPFNQLQCKRVTILVNAKNQPVRAFVERLGFILEGVLKDAHPDDDAALYRMTKDECRWVNGKEKFAEGTRSIQNRRRAG